jgi:hypothetical protein
MRLSEISRTIDIYNKRLYNENMESMPTVYLDMDGVLADFFGGIEKLYGVQHWKELTSDRTKDLKTEVIKKITGTNFFETLPKFNTADALIKLVQDFTGGVYSINTSPLRGDNKNSAYYKKIWIGKHLPKPQEIIVTGRKESYAMNKNNKPNILIDDRPINIQRWTGRGGYGILYQANKDSVDKVKNALEEYKKKYLITKNEGVGIITKQNATKDSPIGSEYSNVKKLGLGKGKPKSMRENFADGKGPGKPGDSQRHGIPKGATMAQLQKAAKAPGRKGQLARWQINMRKGRKKAK